ncbi:AGAP013460-PA-like protein [Anopheles sinensis]|uniref:AGAP013460-PA-like protein n=1 Tax=Anopheles sinensis TaxID=74873 RepID=A0A084WPP3_ANOSI|nr:AGAP013460-PA-like protein [Anopheles sinensis]
MRYVPVATTLLLLLLAIGVAEGAPGALPLVTESDRGEVRDARWTVRPLNANCPQPTCVSWRDLNTLWASPDATLYVRCRPAPTGYWMIELNNCPPGTLFQYSRQACVAVVNWSPC